MITKKPQIQTHVTDLLFIITLFGVFAASALLAVVIGAGVYRTTTQNMDENYARRTSMAYITEKIRQHDCSGSVSIGTKDAPDCLMFHEQYNGEAYTTYIYPDSGQLMELFTKDSLGFVAEYGEPILEIQEFHIESITPGLCRLFITDGSGFTTDMYISVRSDENGGDGQ